MPFHTTLLGFWSELNWYWVVPTATQLVTLPQDTPARPQGAPAGPKHTFVALAQTCHFVPPLHDCTSGPSSLGKISMQEARLPQVMPVRPPSGLPRFTVRQARPFHCSAPVGPPAPTQNALVTHDTELSSVPGTPRTIRHLLPFQTWASAWTLDFAV